MRCVALMMEDGGGRFPCAHKHVRKSCRPPKACPTKPTASLDSVRLYSVCVRWRTSRQSCEVCFQRTRGTKNTAEALKMNRWNSCRLESTLLIKSANQREEPSCCRVNNALQTCHNREYKNKKIKPKRRIKHELNLNP